MTNVFQNYNIIRRFYFWRVWRVLLVIANPPSLWLFDFVPHIHLSPHSFQENWHDHKKFWRFHQIPNHCSRGLMQWASIYGKVSSHTPPFYFSHSAMSYISLYIIQSAYFYWVIKLWEFFLLIGWCKYCILALLCVFSSSDCIQFFSSSSMLQLACQFLLASLAQIFFQFHLAWFS